MSDIVSWPADQYHASDGVSGSMLSVLAEECPAKLKAIIDGKAEQKTDALTFGTVFHRYVLEPETLEGAFHVKPDGMSFATKEGKEWRAAHADRPIVAAQDVADVQGMVASLQANTEFMRTFKGGVSEQSLFATDEKGTLRKGRIDRLHTSGNFILDLKSCESASPSRFSHAVEKYGYYRKAAWYLDLARLCGMNKEIFIFAAVEKTPPYISQMYQLEDDDLALGFEENERLLEVYRACLKSGIWKDYGGGMLPIGIPEHKRSYLTQRLH